MLRLWPERFALNLFAERSSLRAGKRAHEVRVEDVNTGLLAMADQLLALAPVDSYWRPSLDLIVSDESARLLLLPWQERLRTSAQQLGYAEACMVDSGAALDGDWLVQAGFRHYGHAGLALAVRRDFVDGVMAVASAHRLRLRSLLPVSVAAYWRYRGERSGRESLLLLCEKNRVTAMRYRGRALQAVDVQPVGGDRPQAVLRLLRRQLAGTMPHSLACWFTSNDRIAEQAVVSSLPGPNVKQLPGDYWG